MNLVAPIEVLLIEDNFAETELVTQIFDEGITVNVIKVNDGIEAMDFLHKKGKYKNSRLPSLILLDLNLPKKNGHEVLEEIKHDEVLKCIPVIVLTNSSDNNDIFESYGQYANAYITKPTDFNEFRRYMLTFKDFWLNSVKLPQIE
ncbi:response regulator [Methanobacterium sp.]|uniref:response regulator n=1 Tax=Methanobacterium sp. TaxID=2164 RepID=UPI003C710982